MTDGPIPCRHQPEHRYDRGRPPDLGPIIASDDAATAASELLGEFEASGGAYHLGTLTDEELVVCTGSLDAAQPTGQWFPQLGNYPQHVAKAAAYRSLTSREEVMAIMRGDDLDVMVSQRLMGLLRLRHAPALLTVQTVTRQGPGWYVLRRCDGAWLREVVTGHGIHTHDLVRLDEEEVFFRGFTFLLDRNTASPVSGLRQPGGGAAAPGEVLAFLAQQRHLSQLALVNPDLQTPETFVVCADETGATTIGETVDGDIVYGGADPQSIVGRWRAWRDEWLASG